MDFNTYRVFFIDEGMIAFSNGATITPHCNQGCHESIYCAFEQADDLFRSSTFHGEPVIEKVEGQGIKINGHFFPCYNSYDRHPSSNLSLSFNYREPLCLSDCLEKEEIMKFKNFTPHEINIVGQEPMPSVGVARCSEVVNVIDNINGIEIISKKFGDVTGLPEKEEGVGIIVSMLVAAASPNRNDLFTPGELVRNEAGQITGCKNLCKHYLI